MNSIHTIESYSYWLPMISAALLIACITAPIGCFIVWQKKSFLGETLAHASLSGIALSFILKIPPFFGIVAVGLLLTWMLRSSYHKQKLPKDASLALMSQGGLALGLLLLSLLKGQRIDINAYLFGDLLTVSSRDVMLCAGLLAVLSVFLWLRFQNILAYIIHEDLAQVENLMSRHLPLQLSAIITFSIAVLLPMVGMLLLTALMIIPAATARYCSQTPQAMMTKSIFFSIFTLMFGMWLSFEFDLPMSPTMVIVGLSIFLIIKLKDSLKTYI